MSEEWCANTTFYDWQDFELTPYGKIKKEFLNFVKKYDIGKPLTPVAAVLPKDFKFIHSIHDASDFYMNTIREKRSILNVRQARNRGTEHLCNFEQGFERGAEKAVRCLEL